MNWVRVAHNPPAADTLENCRSWKGRVGIGTTRGVWYGAAQPFSSRYTRAPSILDGPCGDRDARRDLRMVHNPPVADTPESLGSWQNHVGIGTPRGYWVQVVHNPPSADMPESPRSCKDCGDGDRGQLIWM